MPGEHLAYKHTFDKVHDRVWWPTLHHDVENWCRDYEAYQRWKLPHYRAELLADHLLLRGRGFPHDFFGIIAGNEIQVYGNGMKKK